jgi:hypothetical protein
MYIKNGFVIAAKLKNLVEWHGFAETLSLCLPYVLRNMTFVCTINLIKLISFVMKSAARIKTCRPVLFTGKSRSENHWDFYVTIL